jgi:hypothetical protein
VAGWEGLVREKGGGSLERRRVEWVEMDLGLGFLFFFVFFLLKLPPSIMCVEGYYL